MSSSRRIDQTTRYARDVVKGKIVAGEFVRAQCQKIAAMRRAAQKRLTAVLPPSAIKLLPGSGVTASLPAPFTRMNGTWQVEEAQAGVWLQDGEDGKVAFRVPVTLKEDAPAVYAWDPETEEQEIQTQSLTEEDVFLGTVQNLAAQTVEINSGGAVVLMIEFEFDPVTDYVIDKYEVSWRENGQMKFIPLPDIPSSAVDDSGKVTGQFGPVEVGKSYDLGVRAVGPTSEGLWSYVLGIIAGFDLTAVSATAVVGGLEVSGTSPDSGILKAIRLYRAGVGEDFADAVQVGSDIPIGRNTSFTVKLVFRQPSVSNQGFIQPDGSIRMEAGAYLAEPQAKLSKYHRLVPSNVRTDSIGGVLDGFTNTGLCAGPLGEYIVAQEGRRADDGTGNPDTDWQPSLVRVSNDFGVKLAEYDLSALYSETFESAQGAAYDASREQIWWIETKSSGTRYARAINLDGTLVGDGTTRRIALPARGNGCAIDPGEDELYVSASVSASGVTSIWVYDLDTLALQRTISAQSIDIDCLTIFNGYLYATSGANGADGYLTAMTLEGKFLTRITLPGATAIEGVMVEAYGDKLRVLTNQDGLFHPESGLGRNLVAEHIVDPLVSDAWSADMLLSMLLCRGDERSDTETRNIYSWRKQTSDAGAALYFADDEDKLSFLTENADGTTSATEWVVEARDGPTLISLMFTDGAGPTLYVNGVSVSGTTVSGTPADYSFGFTWAQAYIGGETREVQMSLWGVIGATDPTQREIAEGWLAHTAGQVELLPSGHTYKYAPPGA